MAEECTESSVATSSPTPPYLWDLHASSLSSWNNSNLWGNQNPDSNSSCEEDVSISTSFTNVSNHSGLTVESSRRLVETASSNVLIGDHASDNNLWSHLVLSVGSNGELQKDQDGEENFVDALSSKSMSTGIFEPACDYLKKLDNSWELTNSTSLNHFDKHLSGFSESILDNERLTKLSNQVSTWSIAPPHPDVHGQFNSQECNISLSSTRDHYQHPDPYDHMKQTFGDSSPCYLGPTRTSGLFSRNGQDLEVMRERLDTEVPLALLRGSLNSNGVGFPVGLNSSFVGDKTGNYKGRPNYSCSKRIRSFEDGISFGNRIGKPSVLDVHAPNFCSKSTKYSSEYKKQALHISSPTRVYSKGQGTANEGKRKRFEDGSDSVLKKSKSDSSTSSSLKAPKVKLADRITALQQIVSPFGKTDTASVLFEAIQYITFLQDQVQLLMSNPYMKTNPHKDQWGGFDRKDKGAETKHDLRSRGLCLVPISYTPQIYRENAGSYYWSTTPAYRGCLYR